MMSWFDVLMEPLSFDFMQRALLTAAATSIVCAITMAEGVKSNPHEPSGPDRDRLR